jgi:hypothetical protein
VSIALDVQPIGNWAMKIVAKVVFGEGRVAPGEGEIDQWVLLNIRHPDGERTLAGSVKLCGLTFPDFHSGGSLGDETYGMTLDASAFDSPYVTPAAFVGQLTEPASRTTLEAETSTMFLGLDVSPPASATGDWPASYGALTAENGYTLIDVDRDGFPGITASLKTGSIPGKGTSYADIIWDIGNPPLRNPKRASKLRLALRSTVMELGTLDTCSQVSGAANVVVDHHVVGCFPDSSTTGCSPDLVDTVRPIYTTTSASFVARHIGSQETCSAVRTAVP